MEFSSGRRALNNISFLISDPTPASEDLLIGLPVLMHLGIDSRTLLEPNNSQLDVMDCSSIPLPTASKTFGSLGRLIIARLERSDSNGKTVDDIETSDTDQEEATSTS